MAACPLASASPRPVGVARYRHNRLSEVAISNTRLFTVPRVLGVVVLVVALVAAFVVLSSSAPARSCVGTTRTTTSPGGLLSTATTKPGTTFTTLPPSRDNDAGRSRIPDATPDADNDTSRAREVCATN